LAQELRHLKPPLTGLAEECRSILHGSAVAGHTVKRLMQENEA
jgi:hypothetical protein